MFRKKESKPKPSIPCKEEDDILVKPTEDMINKMKDIIVNNKGAITNLVLKGVPLGVAIWIVSPVLILFWSWLPWLISIYYIYNMLPTGSSLTATALLKLLMK